MRRIRRIAAVTALLALLPALASFIDAVAQPSNSSLSIRSVEWIKANGLAGLVNQIESIYYSMNAPTPGGKPLKQLPKLAGSAVAALGHVIHYSPAPIGPLISPALAGEGIWRAPYAGHQGPAPLLVTSFRTDPVYPQMVAGVAWIDHTQTTTWLYPGVQEPAVAMPDRGPETVPTDLRSHLLATFNSGFKLSDSGGGFASGGHTYAPMKNGLATLVRFRSGKVDVIEWEGGPKVGPDVVYARQNLPLILQAGRPNRNIAAGGPAWGLTLGNAVRVWRTAVGIDRRGNLIYAAADQQTAESLAGIMRHAGAVRAMELDINAYWPSFITYTAPGAVGATNLLPGMIRSPQRYLTPDDRDFFAVYLK